MDPIKILLADDHALIRTGIKNLLEGHSEFKVVGEASDGDEALQKAKSLSPDVVIIDISMPKLSGIEATRQIVKRHPSTRVLVLTMHENAEYVYQIFKAGAGGYILKNAGKEELIDAIRSVADGKRFVGRHVSELMISEYMKKADERDGSAGQTALTSREREILELIAQGLNNQQIGERLFISPRTVDTHRTNIMQKLHVHDAANLVRYALEHGFGAKK
ncbi:MAG TPA: response regulator transcription factor [Bacteroidota bacterium]|nr:response regulator transcription factor [Bacteroidota bacterium]